MTGNQINMLERAAKLGGSIWLEGAGQFRTADSLSPYLEQSPRSKRVYMLTPRGWQRLTELLLAERDKHEKWIRSTWDVTDALQKRIEALETGK